jgi:chemotaxis protein histidine kinase CheA
MGASAGLLDFFILEASDYIEQLDGLVARAGGGTPDADSFTRNARSLRGSATMARLGGIAEIAGNLERIGRGLREGSVRWNEALQGAAVAAIDDLKTLLRTVRTWGESEDRRVATRLADLAKFTPAAATARFTPAAAGMSAGFLGAETLQIAAALDAFIAKPAERAAFTLALGRVRALRGVAALKDLPPLAEVVDVLERVGKPVELSGGVPDAAHITLFRAATQVLRRASQEIGTRGAPAKTSPEMDAFIVAAAALEDASQDSEQIVPVATLFFGDAGPHVVSTAAHPPTTPRERFRLEVVSQAEHLRRLIAETHAAPDAAALERLSRPLRAAVRALQAAADSFEERDLASFLGRASDSLPTRSASGAAGLNADTITALDEVAAMLAAPATPPGQLANRLRELSVPRPPRHTPAASARGRHPTPTGKELQNFLQSGIAGFSTLSDRPLSEPVPLIDEAVVPIQTLLYSGRGALERARELRHEIAQGGGTPSAEALAELFDLLDLAATD